MSHKSSAQNIISSYRKKQQMGPFLIGGLAVVLVVIGILVLVLWLTGDNKPAISLFASATPTSTSTFTPTATVPSATPTATSTETPTATVTLTPTPSGPFEYVVQEGDNCYLIAEKYKANINVLIALNPGYGATCNIKPGDKLLVPLPDQKMPTPTPLPTNFRGDIKYTVMSGDTLGGLAARFNSTVAAIKTKNKLTSDTINAGIELTIPVGIATPVPTRPATVAPSATATNKP